MSEVICDVVRFSITCRMVPLEDGSGSSQGISGQPTGVCETDH